MEKSKIFFSANTIAEDKEMVRNILNVHTDLVDGKYLGLLILIGPENYTPPKNKCKLIHSWSGKMIFQAGKAILIQSVAQEIPIYMISYLLFPKGFIQEVNMLLVGFWWRDTSRARKIH